MSIHADHQPAQEGTHPSIYEQETLVHNRRGSQLSRRLNPRHDLHLADGSGGSLWAR